jgi:hypothetical protein
VVLFSILAGIALIGIKEKDSLVQGLMAVSGALIRMTNIVVKLTPIGVFAIAASAAGTMTVEEFGKLQVYLVSFNLAAVLLTFPPASKTGNPLQIQGHRRAVKGCPGDRIHHWQPVHRTDRTDRKLQIAF